MLKSTRRPEYIQAIQNSKSTRNPPFHIAFFLLPSFLFPHLRRILLEREAPLHLLTPPRSSGVMRRPILPRSLFVFVLFVLHFSPKPSQSETDGNFRVGVVLNHNSTLANMSRLCLEMALSDFYLANNNYKTKLALQFRFPQPGPVPAASAAVDLMVNERVHAILGPQTSDEAAFVALIGTKTKVPIISFSATSPSVSPKKTRFFVRAALNDSSQANATVALIRYFCWNQIVPVYELSEYGTGMMPYIVDAVKSVGVTVPHSISIPSSALDDFISAELYKAKSMEGRVFFVHMTKKLALRFFSKAKEAGMMTEGFAWILSEGLTSQLGTVDPTVLGQDFYGVVGLKAYVSRTAQVADFDNRWKRKWRNEYPESDISDPNVIGLWAYDSIWALAAAAEKVGPEEPGYSGSSQNLTEVTDFSSIGFSKTGERLLEAILAADFEGMSGDFRLSGGELGNPVYEIVNVVDSSERTIGYWTKDGLQKNLNNFTNRNMSTVIWPGDKTTVPKGWVYPITGKKLRILVPGPVDPGFHSFLRADKNNETNEVEVGGFVIEVFEAALKHLPYPVLVEYHQVSTEPRSTYNDLVRLISEKEYDGLVGDVTITANRSNYADFTLPYTTTGVSMIVPLKDDRKMSALFFRRPFSTTMWIVSGAFFIFTGLIVWILEHQYSDDFRGPWHHQVGTTFFFIFSTLVFAHREKMQTNLSRIVLIIWMYVVLVLQSSYTASLTSMLTVKHLRPTTTDIRHFVDNKENVGYLKSSFTKALLLGEGFKENQLKPFRSPQEYLEALNKGTENGGVGAIVDEIPYLRLFLKDYCKNYTMAGNPYKAGGFGFVFPKGSSLVPDLSLAILKMGEGDEMIQIEKRWFGSLSSCTMEENSLTSERLTVGNFWGLFLITGLVSGIAFLTFFLRFLYQQQQEFRGEGAWKEKLKNLWKRYQEKDYSSPTFRKRMKKSERSRNGDPSRSPLSCDCGRSAMQSPVSTFMGRLGDGSGSPVISGCSTPWITLDRNKGEYPNIDLISPLERGALSPKS